MTPQRRKAVSLCALAPTVLIAIGYGFEWGYQLPLVGVVGGLVMVAAAWLAVYAVLPGVHAERGLPAVFVLGWGAAVLAAALGASGAAVVGNELLQRGFGADPRDTAAPYSRYESGGSSGSDQFAVVASEAYSNRLMVAQSNSVVPDGTAAGALLTGWLAGGAGAIAYARTRPSAAAGGRTADAPDRPNGTEDPDEPGGV